MKMNPIRCEQGASLLEKGEACGISRERGTALSMSKPGPSSLLVWLGQAGSEGLMWKMRELPGQDGVHGQSGPKSRPAAVRAPIVAKKRVMTVERRGVGRGRQCSGKAENKTRKNALMGYVSGRLITPSLPHGCFEQRSVTITTKVFAWYTASSGALARQRELPDWRAGCGSSARPVRWEGWTFGSIPTQSCSIA